MEQLTPSRRRTRSVGSKGDVTPPPSKENRNPGSGSVTRSGRRRAKSPKSPKNDSAFSGLSDDSFHSPPLQENNSVSENLSLSFSTETDSIIGPASRPAAKRMTADPDILKDLIDNIGSEKRLSVASKSPRAAKSPAKSPGKTSSAKKRQSAKKQQDRRKTVDGTALTSLMNELADDSIHSNADSSMMSARSPASARKQKQEGNRRHTADPSFLRELMDGGESVATGDDASNDSLSFTLSSSNGSVLFESDADGPVDNSLNTSSVGASLAPGNLKRRSLGMGRHRDSLSHFMAQLESSVEDASALSDDDNDGENNDAQSEKRRKSTAGRTPRRETASPGVLEALVHELQNERASIEPTALGEIGYGSPTATVTGPISLADSSMGMQVRADKTMEEEQRRQTASPGMLTALMDDLQDDSQQPQPGKRRRSSAFSPSPRRSKRLLHQSPSPVDTLQSLESPKPAKTPQAEPVVAAATTTTTTTTDHSGIFAMPTTTGKAPLRGILSSQKKPRPKEAHSHKKSVMFGSPEAAEFVADDPSMSYTPLQKQVAKSLFPMEPAEQVEEEDAETSYNSHVLEEWERLSAASDGDGSPLVVDDDEDDDDEMVQGTPVSTASSRRSRRRKSMLQPSAEKLKALREDLDAESEEEPAPAPQEEEDSRIGHAASPALQPRPSFAPSSVSSLASEDRTAKLPGSLADLLREEGDKFVGRPSVGSSRLSFLSDDDHTAQLPGNLADLLREEGDMSMDASGHNNTVELESNLAGLLQQTARPVPAATAGHRSEHEYELEDSTGELSGFLVQRGRLSAIAEAAEISTSDSAHSTSSAGHDSRLSTPSSVRSARSARSAHSKQSTPDKSAAYSPARSSLSGYRHSTSNVSASSPTSRMAESEVEESFMSERAGHDHGDAEASRSSPAPVPDAASHASLAVLQRLKQLNTESRQASLNVCATPLAGLDPNASRLSVSRRLSVMETNAKNNRSQLGGTGRRQPSWIPPGASMDSSEELDVSASVLADNTNIISHGSPEAVRQDAAAWTLDDALEWALEREEDADYNHGHTFVHVFGSYLEQALGSGDAAAHEAAQLLSSKLLEILPMMMDELSADLGTAMESARNAWDANEPGVAVVNGASTSEAHVDALQRTFDAYHTIVTSDWDMLEDQLANLLESEMADEIARIEQQVDTFSAHLHELSLKREEMRKTQASQRILQDLEAANAKIAQAHAELAQLRQQMDDLASSEQQLLVAKQQTLEEMATLPARLNSSLDENRRLLKLQQQYEREAARQLVVRQSMGWWRLHEHRATAMSFDLVVLPAVQFRLEFKLDDTPELNLVGLSVRQLPSTGGDRTTAGLATALVEDILKGDAGPLSPSHIHRWLAQGWCDPVALLKQVDGFIASTRMVMAQLASVLSNPDCVTRVEKEQKHHYLVVEVNNRPRGRNVTLRLPVRSLVSWDRTMQSLGIDCTAKHEAVEQVHERIMGSLRSRVPALTQDISLPLCPVEGIVKAVQDSITKT